MKTIKEKAKQLSFSDVWDIDEKTGDVRPKWKHDMERKDFSCTEKKNNNKMACLL